MRSEEPILHIFVSTIYKAEICLNTRKYERNKYETDEAEKKARKKETEKIYSAQN